MSYKDYYFTVKTGLTIEEIATLLIMRGHGHLFSQEALVHILGYIVHRPGKERYWLHLDTVIYEFSEEPLPEILDYYKLGSLEDLEDLTYAKELENGNVLYKVMPDPTPDIVRAEWI